MNILKIDHKTNLTKYGNQETDIGIGIAAFGIGNAGGKSADKYCAKTHEN
jgi:hypothetical protein